MVCDRPGDLVVFFVEAEFGVLTRRVNIPRLVAFLPVGLTVLPVDFDFLAMPISPQLGDNASMIQPVKTQVNGENRPAGLS